MFANMWKMFFLVSVTFSQGLYQWRDSNFYKDLKMSTLALYFEKLEHNKILFISIELHEIYNYDK